jgi:rubrerythrin
MPSAWIIRSSVSACSASPRRNGHRSSGCVKLLALGGELPVVSLPPKGAKNAWQALLTDLEKEKRSYTDVIEAMHIAEQADPEIAAGLQRIREAERQHREELLDMLVKSDPYTLPQAPVEERA